MSQKQATYDLILELRLLQHGEPDEILRFGIVTETKTEEEDYDNFRRIGGDLGLQEWLRRSFFHDKWVLLPQQSGESK